MDDLEVLNLLRNHQPSVAELRQMFTKEQVQGWGKNTGNMLVTLAIAPQWSSVWITDVMRWMIEECGYSLAFPFRWPFPLEPLFHAQVLCSESSARLKLFLKHGARFNPYDFIHTLGCRAATSPQFHIRQELVKKS